MKVACCQLDIVWENPPANQEKVRKLLEKKVLPAGSLLVLPEMFPSGFSMNVDSIVERSPFPSEAFLRSVAVEHGLFVMGGFAAAGSDNRARNHAVVISPEGDTLARYDKIHPFTLGGEAQHYAAGAEIVTFQWQSCVAAPFICYDLRFPEIFRAAALNGAQLFLVIANWPVKREMHWVTLLQARAIENQAYVVGVNRCGTDPKFVYSGRSMVVDPHGTILAQIGNEEGIISADVDVEALQCWRKDFPALQDIHWRPWCPHVTSGVGIPN
jgi:predicted amidohydrolase